MACLMCSRGCLIRHLKFNASKQISWISLAQPPSCLPHLNQWHHNTQFVTQAKEQIYHAWFSFVTGKFCWFHCPSGVTNTTPGSCTFSQDGVTGTKFVLSHETTNHCPPKRQNTWNNGFQGIHIRQWRTVIPEKWERRWVPNCPKLPLGEFSCCGTERGEGRAWWPP